MNTPKKRKDSFFGIHFDFHAMPGQIVAYPARPELIGKLLDEVKPDYVQIDTKGHPGLSSYPTKVGNAAKDIRMDMLKVWRKETKKRGIALYGHHSGLFDKKAIELNPDYAAVNSKGEASSDYVSVFSEYPQKLLIPQIKELAGEYGLDGIWVDGECWGMRIDYSENAKRVFGNKIPQPDEEDYGEYCDFVRDAFEKYVQNYIDEIKKEYPAFQITSNWIYSHYMPILPKVTVDFLSGDYDCGNAVESARKAGRFLYLTGKPWDLMSWGQNAKKCSWSETDRTVKEYSQYCQEAAMVIALGGGFEFFNIIYGGGGCIQEWAIPMWKRVAKFVRQREQICYKSRLYHQAGVMHCDRFSNDPDRTPFSPVYAGVTTGWINALQDTQRSSEIIAEHQAELQYLSQFKVIVLPSAQSWQENTIENLKKYVENGGILIAEGESTGHITSQKADRSSKLLFIDGKGTLASLNTVYTSSSVKEENVVLNCYSDNYYSDENKLPLAEIEKYGKGRIVKLFADIGSVYSDNRSAAIKRFIDALMEKSGVEFDVTVTGSRYVEMTYAHKDGKRLVNLINIAGEHGRGCVRSFDEIPPIANVRVCVRCQKKPKKVILQPENKSMDYSFDGAYLRLTVPMLEIHSVIVIED